MQFKRSCFNPTLARHNLKRFWPLPVLIFLLFLLVLVLDYHSSLRSLANGDTLAPYDFSTAATYEEPSAAEVALRSSRNAVYSFATTIIILQAFTALLSGLLVMHHIHGRKQIQFYHGLPLSRKCIYTTGVVSGFLMGFVPLLLVEGIMGMIALAFQAELFPIFQLMGLSLASFLISYSLAILAGVLAGQTLGAALIYIGLNGAVAAISLGAAGVFRYLLPGFNEDILLNDIVTVLTPVMNLISKDGPLTTGESYPIPYGFQVLPFLGNGLVGLAILIGTYFLYKIRPGETAGEMISFPVIRTVCKALVALIAGFGGTVILVLMLYPDNDIAIPVILLMVAVLLICGWVAAEMVIQKTFRIFAVKNTAQCLSLTAAVLLLLVGARMDLFGYVERIPEQSDVTRVTIYANGSRSVEISYEDAVWLHQLILDNRQELSNTTTAYNTTSIQLRYWNDTEDAKNVPEMERTYYTKLQSEKVILDALMELMENPEYCRQTWIEGDGPITEETLEYVQLYTSFSYSETDENDTPYLFIPKTQSSHEYYTELTKAEGVTLYNAIMLDIQQGNLPPRIYMSNFHFPLEYGTLEIQHRSAPYSAAEYGSYGDYLEQTTSYYDSIAIYETMTNTLNALDEMGCTLNPKAFE